LLTVLAPNREIIDNSAQQVTSYQGVLPVSGRYIIQLTSAQEVPQSNYVLNVGLENLELTPTPEPTPEPTFTPTLEPFTPTPYTRANTRANISSTTCEQFAHTSTYTATRVSVYIPSRRK
jgi:hypothetical protein